MRDIIFGGFLAAALIGCTAGVEKKVRIAGSDKVRSAEEVSESEEASPYIEYTAARIPKCTYHCEYKGREFEYTTGEFVIGSICVLKEDAGTDDFQTIANDNARYGTQRDCYRSPEEACALANPDAKPRDSRIDYVAGGVTPFAPENFCNYSGEAQSIFTHFDAYESYGGLQCKNPDTNDDGVVDAADAATLMSTFGQSGDGDLNDDGTTDAADFEVLFENWSSK